MSKYVYLFHEGNAKMKDLLGGKGANLAEMTSLGLPVPRGFTVTTEACTRYYNDGKTIGKDIESEILRMLATLEHNIGKKFGDVENPLLVSVRSGSRASMPGMMDTILNLGLNDEVVEGLARLTGNVRFAYDSYRRFIQMFGDVVMEVKKEKFDGILNEAKASGNLKNDTDLTADHLKDVTEKYKELFLKEKGFEFPQDPKDQLIEAIKAVFRSWNNDRAVVYRRLNDIPVNWGTAVNVQEMVYGNMGEDSGTGVAFTRNPNTGEKVIYGEYLMNAQGEDVVAGVRTPKPLEHLKRVNPEAYGNLLEIADILEKHYRDMQDMEFTVERGKLFMLQTRDGKRTGTAAIKIAVDLVNEEMLSEEQALMKVDPRQLDALLHPDFDPSALKNATPIGKGLPASPGAATGKIFFDAKDAVKAFFAGESEIILVRDETSPEDIEGMNIAEGILTSRGGMTSHAAVVARGMGKCCVAGCDDLIIDEKEKYMMAKDGTKFLEGDWISMNGTSGKVYGEKLPTVDAEMSEDFDTVMFWADKFRTLKVRTNADAPKDAEAALKFGAEGIGLCRTEHMFFEEDRITAMREMIVSKTEAQRRRALEKILPMQKEDFEGIFRVMGERPVTIRLLDPPLHEFLPKKDEDIIKLADEMEISHEEIRNVVAQLKETNPMLGNRGCRLAIIFPEIAEMQTRAIIEAALTVLSEGIPVSPEIMIPLVCDSREFIYMKNVVVNIADKLIKEAGAELKYLVGTMIEIPRACLTADIIAKDADFFSFGTNDLTQMTYGLSRDDAGKILDTYFDKRIFEYDPTTKIDTQGVGQLMKIAVKLGRGAKEHIKLGICGEHGGEPSSVEFCHRIGMEYVSCSPFRVPVAKLAAAQAMVKAQG